MADVKVTEKDGKIIIEPTPNQKEERNDEKIQKALIITIKEIAWVIKQLGAQQGYDVTFTVEENMNVDIGEHSDILTKL